LKPIAALRAPTIAIRIQNSLRHGGGPLHRERGRCQREGQREDRVRELDHAPEHERAAEQPHRFGPNDT
jgi:hypothetical protein